VACVVFESEQVRLYVLTLDVPPNQILPKNNKYYNINLYIYKKINFQKTGSDQQLKVMRRKFGKLMDVIMIYSCSVANQAVEIVQ
jgi:hypothetical protein